MKDVRPLLAALCLATLAPVLSAAELELSVEVPRIDVAEYHRPYVAAWIERADRSVAAQLSVWYQLDRPMPPGAAPRGESGTKWLPDLRQWWRRGGRALPMPVDGLSSATRPVGTHLLSFDGASPTLAALDDGAYRLVVEAVREEGGREQLTLDFDWPPSAAQLIDAQGRSELGAVHLQLTP
jgi:hypothetical protein